MKYLLALALLFYTFPAKADPRIDNMFSHCRCVMDGGVCKFENGRALKPGSRIITALGPIAAADYNELKAAGVLMCVDGRDACTADFNSPKCRVFRTWYRQEPVVCGSKK